jgi:hypothetical protein
MPAFNSTDLLKNIRFNQLKIEKGEVSGDLVSGGVITNFSSTGIRDRATTTTVKITDGQLAVDKIKIKAIDGDVDLTGNLKVSGDLTADKLYVSEVISSSTYGRTYLEFQPVDEAENPNGSGMIWKGKDYTKLFVLRSNSPRFFSSESFDLAKDRCYQIDGLEVLTKNTLGPSIKKSSLREVGTLNKLDVTGDVNLAEFISISSDQQRISINSEQMVGIITISDLFKDVILKIDSDDGRGKIGTYNNRPLDIISGDMTMMTIEPKGIVSVGSEYRSDLTTRLWGKVGINVKTPDVDLEVRGSIRFGGKLFMVDNSPPEKGNYKRGDIIWNDSPGNNSPIGWVCTVSGTPGVWVQFGMIQS